VLTAVDFDDKLRVLADEIADIRADRHLAAKLCAGKSSVSQGEPELLFCLRRVPPKSPCSSNRHPHPPIALRATGPSLSRKRARDSWRDRDLMSRCLASSKAIDTSPRPPLGERVAEA
jgi:hypothetical protein